MFLFQVKKEIKEKRLHPFVRELIYRTGLGFSDEQKQQLVDYVEKRGESKENNRLDVYFGSKSAAESFENAIREMEPFLRETYGITIKVEIKKEGTYYVAHMTRSDVLKPEVLVRKELTLPSSLQKPTTPPTTMDDVERKAQRLRESGYQGVEIVDSEEEARKKLEEFPKGSEMVFEKYTIETEINDDPYANMVRIFASSMSSAYKYTTYLEYIPEGIHPYGYYFTPKTGYYSIPRDRNGHGTDEGALNIRRYAGNVGGTAAYIYNAQASFLSRNYSSKTAKNCSRDPLCLAAYLMRGYTGVLHKKQVKDEQTGEVKYVYDEQKTINMHRTNINTLVNAYRTFEGIRGTIPDDLWVSLRAFSYAQAENAADLGIIDKGKKDKYADAFAFGMLAQIWYESGLTLTEFFSWLREETDMVIDPYQVITNIMKVRDEYRLFYGDEEITETTIVKASPYKDLLITMPDGKTPLAHLRISHPRWLDKRAAWDGNYTYRDLLYAYSTKTVQKDKVFATSVAKWSWYGFGGTAYYHEINTELYFSLTKTGVEDVYLIGYKPVEEKPVEVVNAFSVVGDREARIVGTTFETNGRIIAYGNKSVNDLKNDDGFSLQYIGFAPTKEEREMWLPGLRGKKERYVAYLLIPEGDPIEDRLPSGVHSCEKNIQNGALVYEDYRYDLILTINGKRTNVLPGIPKFLIDKGLKPENLYYEINTDGTLDIAVLFDERGNIIKDPSKYAEARYVEVIASGVELSPEDVKAITGKPISDFASFEDNGRTGLDLYTVVKINPDGTKTLVDAARIAGHEFDYKFLYENGYAKEYFGSLDSSRVVVSDTGERSYHIIPTDIPPDYSDLLVGTIPRELITASKDGKEGMFKARFYQNTEMVKGIKGVYVNYYMNYTGKPPVSFELANLPVSIETLTSKDSKTRKAAIAQLLSLSQNPVSPAEASNYIGLISEVEAKWKDVLDKEDRKNLAEARANFERYSGMVRAGEVAAGVSARTPTTIEVPTPPTFKLKEEFPAPTSVIPTDLFTGEVTEERIRGAFFDLWSALFTDAYMNYEGKPASERINAVRKYMEGFMKHLGLPTSEEYARMTEDKKEEIRYKLFADPHAATDEQTMMFLDALYSGDIGRLMQLLKESYASQSPIHGAFEGMKNVKIYIPRQMVVTGVGGTIFTFESEGYKGGKLGAPQKGLAINFSAFVDFMRELYMERSLDINFEDATITLNERALERYGVEPKFRARIEEILEGGEELYAEGTIGLRFIFDNAGRLQTTYGTPRLTVGVGNVRIGNVIVGIEGDYTKLPVFQGTVDRYTLEGKADFLLLVPWEVKAGGRITAGERTAFAVVGAKLVESEGGFFLQPFVGAEAKGIGELQKWGAGITIGTPPYGSSRFGLWRTKDNWVFDVGIGVEF